MRYGTAVVIMAFDEKGQAATFQDNVCVLRENLDFPPGHSNVLTITAGLSEHKSYGIDFVNAALSSANFGAVCPGLPMKLAQHPRATAHRTHASKDDSSIFPVLVWAHAVLAELEKSSKPKHETPRAVSLPTLLVVPPGVPSRMSEMRRPPLAGLRRQGRFGESCVSFKQLAAT